MAGWQLALRDRQGRQLVLINNNNGRATPNSEASDDDNLKLAVISMGHERGVADDMPAGPDDAGSERVCPLCGADQRDSGSGFGGGKAKRPSRAAERSYFDALRRWHVRRALLGAASPGPGEASPRTSSYYELFFRELARLGTGASGAVFLCEHVLEGVSLGLFAVKKIAIGSSRAQFLRALHEAEVLQSLPPHANVITYRHAWVEMGANPSGAGFGPDVTCLYLLMEYANAGTLAELCGPGPSGRWHAPSETVICSALVQICAGLAHLHAAGLVHADLKPGNVLVSHEPSAPGSAGSHDPTVAGLSGAPEPTLLFKIADVGSCVPAQAFEPPRARTGATGTLHYMAPELLLRNADGSFAVTQSWRTDVWALGVVLHELLFGATPFGEADLATVEALLADPVACEFVIPPTRVALASAASASAAAAHARARRRTDIDSPSPAQRSEALCALVRAMLQPDPSRRPSLAEISACAAAHAHALSSAKAGALTLLDLPLHVRDRMRTREHLRDKAIADAAAADAGAAPRQLQLLMGHAPPARSGARTVAPAWLWLAAAGVGVCLADAYANLAPPGEALRMALRHAALLLALGALAAIWGRR